MTRFQSVFIVGLGALAVSFIGSVVSAGDGNQIYILQQNTSGVASGNTLEVDQSNASNSLIAGAFKTAGQAQNFLTTDFSPALQDGVGNTGTITVKDEGGQVVFLQSGRDNIADVTLASAFGMAYLEQSGTNNEASLTVDANALRGDIQQFGNNNFGSLRVTGTDASGELVQKGDNNSFGFTVSGTNATASYTAIGNNITPAGTGPMVISNGGSVTITQTQLSTR